MSLSGQQHKDLQKALIDAFPDIPSLEQMLTFQLEKNLRTIAGEGSLRDIVFKLIQTANAQGWIEDLVRAARRENSGNQLLRTVAEELLPNYTPEPDKVLSPNNNRQEKTQNWSIGESFIRRLIAGIISRWRESFSPFQDNSFQDNSFQNNSFQDNYYKNLVYTYRTYRTQGLKTPGAFPPDLEKVFVPLRMVSKSPLQMSSALIQKETTGDLKIWDFLAEIPTTYTYRRILIIAPPGYGKTTLLEHLTLIYAQNTQQQQHPQAPEFIPVLLYLRKIRDQITSSQSPNLAQLVTEVVETEFQEFGTKFDPPLQWFEDRLKGGKCLVMLDGLDEVADINQRQLVSQWVDAQMRMYPETIFILTSRPYGYQEAQLKQQPFCLEVQPFNLRQMEEFINNWYLQNELIRQPGKENWRCINAG